ncbi:hypothetical protein HMPREF1051_0387 [Neisseria sicca VK64]|uniref:Uncharacterized protein n=1 Tax=Neisseria sicca VK64 TaxID=1095748 RepID=I2NS67_NEISI|nr:hypothetical protein HMPREF1051_0387 [Neisseria sicca VK64]
MCRFAGRLVPKNFRQNTHSVFLNVLVYARLTAFLHNRTAANRARKILSQPFSDDLHYP